MADDRVGQQLGNYQLQRLLGSGGFADVYLGEHIHLGTQAAIKVLTTRLTAEDIDGFRTEARTIARLKHPNIVRVLEFGVENGTPFLVMDFASNGTLRSRHPRGSQLGPEIIAGYVKQVAEALQYAHEQKLVHRDIKPENMLLGDRSEVLLSDFGIATVAQSSRYQGTQEVAGTVAYMAPEQVQGHPRPASDQYALGIVVYEWLTGTRPFHGSFTEIATQHVLAPPPPLREKLPSISPAIEQVVLIALAKDPKERFASVQAFAVALEQAMLLDQPTQRRSSAMPSSMPPTIVVPPSRAPSNAAFAPTIRSHPTADPSKPIGSVICICRGHTSDVDAVAWSPDSTRIVSGSADKTVQTWNTTNGGNILTYRGHKGPLGAVAWSPDGQRIASAGFDSEVQVWHASSGSRLFTYQGHTNRIFALAWSPDGRQIAGADLDGSIYLCDAFTGNPINRYQGHRGTVFSIAWSPDGNRLVSAGFDKTVRIWNSITGQEILRYDRHTSPVRAVSWSPDGRSIASGGADSLVQVWDAMSGSHLLTYKGHSNWVFTLGWSPNGQYIASGSWDNTVQVWNAPDGRSLYTYRNHSADVRALAWSPHGSYIASASKDQTVQVWQAPHA